MTIDELFWHPDRRRIGEFRREQIQKKPADIIKFEDIKKGDHNGTKKGRPTTKN